MSLLQQVAIALVVAYVTYLVYRRARAASLRKQHGCELPRRYSHKDPIFGLDLFFRNGNAYETNTYLTSMSDLYQKHGNTFEAVYLGSRMLYTIEPDNLRAIFSTNAADWGVQPIRLAAMEPFCGRGFLTVDGDLWHRSRKMFQPSFEKKAISDFTALEEFTQVMLAQIRADEEVDMAPLLSSLFIDATTLFLFGESFGSLPNASTTADVSAAFDAAMFGSGKRIALGPMGFLAKTAPWLAACKRAQAFADHYVERAIANASPPTKSKTLLQSLAQQTTDKAHLRNEVLQAFFVAQGTTAHCVSNTLFELARSPGLWAMLRAEVHAAIGPAAQPTYVQLRAALPRLRAVLAESLRLRPVLPQNNRVALRDTCLPIGGGPRGDAPVFVAKGDAVSISYWDLHRRVDLWGPDAALFKPERWGAESTTEPSAKSTTESTTTQATQPELTTEQAQTKKFAYLPFGAGPRQCIGRDKGSAEAAYVLVRLLQAFGGIEARDARPWQGRVQLSAANVHGCRVVFSESGRAVGG